jgi:adenosylcobyric acid synthase
VKAALKQLEHHDVIMIEGAGSPAEVNLRDSDIVNMSVALETNADVYIVADINRGGAYAHLLGTYMCLSSQEQHLVKGFILNRFRGDESLLEPANQWIEQQTGVAVVAVIPELSHQLPEEDQFTHQRSFTGTAINIGLIGYPWASNLDEFDALFAEPGVNVIPILTASNLTQLDALILPGSKNSGASLQHLKQSGLDQLISNFAKTNKPILGICGGLQILGQQILDPHHIEDGDHQGLNLLPIVTQLQPQKIKQQTTVTTEFNFEVSGYEIHCGVSTALTPDLVAHTGDIGWRQDNIGGTYLHNIFMNTQYRQQFLNSLGWQGQCQDWAEFIDNQLNSLSEHPKIAKLVNNILASPE